MKMPNPLKSWTQACRSVCPGSQLPCGTVCVLALAGVCSSAAGYRIPGPELSLEPSALTGGHVHRLFTFVLLHRSVSEFLLSSVLMAFPCSGLERGLGTLRFLHRSLLLTSITGLAHVLLQALLLSPASRSSVSGLVPLALSVLGLVTISSAMQKAYIMGVSVPSASLPWIILIIITLFVPNSAFSCNVLAVLTGILYGKGWFSVLDMSESRASILEKKFPFRLLKQIPVVQFVPAAAEERHKPLDLTAAPAGSYPVQAYVPVNPSAGPGLCNSVDGWPVSLNPQQPLTLPSGVRGHAHPHGHSFVPQGPVCPYAQHQFRPPRHMTVQRFSGPPAPQVSPSGEPGFPTMPPGSP